MADFTTTTHADWIPKMWTDEVVASYEANFVVPQLVKTESFGTGAMKGDVFHFPKLQSLTTGDIADNADIEGQAPTESETTVTLNKQKHASIYIMKHLANNLSKYDFRKYYTEKIGNALAKQLNLDCLVTLDAMSVNFVGIAAENSGAGATNVTEAIIGSAMGFLDTADVPQTPRAILLYPLQKQAILQISRFTEQQTAGNGPAAIQGGKVPDVFGMPTHFSTLVSWADPAGTATNYVHKGYMINPEAMVLAIPSMGPEVTYDWIPRRKAWLLSGDFIYGSAAFRTSNLVRIYTDTTATSSTSGNHAP